MKDLIKDAIALHCPYVTYVTSLEGTIGELSKKMPLDDLKNLARLAERINSLEQDLGLGRYSDDERRILYAMSSLADESDTEVRSSAVKDHSLCRQISNPTFYRALRSLIDRGAVARSGAAKMGSYTLTLR